MGTLHLLEAARTTGIERFHLRVELVGLRRFERRCRSPKSAHLTQTISPYAATKIAGEFLCSTYSHLYQMRIVALAFLHRLRPRQRPDLAIHQFTRKIHAGEPIDQFGDGTTRRDYTYIDDIIQGVMAALDYDGPLFDIFNLGESDTDPVEGPDRGDRESAGRKAKINKLAGATGRCAADLRRYFESAKAARLQSDHAVERRAAEIRGVVLNR